MIAFTQEKERGPDEPSPAPEMSFQHLNKGYMMVSALASQDEQSTLNEVDPAYLGTIGRSASAIDSLVRSPGIDLYSERFKLQDVARKLLPKFGIWGCCRHVIPDREQIDIFHNSDHDSASYGGLQTCKSVWVCPVCAARITEIRRDEIQQVVDSGKYHRLLVTFTLRHKSRHTLNESYSAITEARRRLKSGRWFKAFKSRWGWHGSIASQETTVSLVNGWHPHVHELVLLDREMTPEDVQSIADELREKWLYVLDSLGWSASMAHGLDVTDSDEHIANYIAKYGKDPRWGEARELAKGQYKRGSEGHYTPFQLLEIILDGGAPDMPASNAKSLFKEFAEETKGRRQIYWSKGLRAEFGLDDEEIEDAEQAEEKSGELIGGIWREDWSRVLNAKMRGAVLHAASTGDLPKLRGVLAEVGVKLTDESPRPGSVADRPGDPRLNKLERAMLAICQHKLKARPDDKAQRAALDRLLELGYVRLEPRVPGFYVLVT